MADEEMKVVIHIDADIDQAVSQVEKLNGKLKNSTDEIRKGYGELGSEIAKGFEPVSAEADDFIKKLKDAKKTGSIGDIKIENTAESQGAVQQLTTAIMAKLQALTGDKGHSITELNKELTTAGKVMAESFDRLGKMTGTIMQEYNGLVHQGKVGKRTDAAGHTYRSDLGIDEDVEKVLGTKAVRRAAISQGVSDAALKGYIKSLIISRGDVRNTAAYQELASLGSKPTFPKNVLELVKGTILEKSVEASTKANHGQFVYAKPTISKESKYAGDFTTRSQGDRYLTQAAVEQLVKRISESAEMARIFTGLKTDSGVAITRKDERGNLVFNGGITAKQLSDAVTKALGGEFATTAQGLYKKRAGLWDLNYKDQEKYAMSLASGTPGAYIQIARDMAEFFAKGENFVDNRHKGATGFTFGVDQIGGRTIYEPKNKKNLYVIQSIDDNPNKSSMTSAAESEAFRLIGLTRKQAGVRADNNYDLSDAMRVVHTGWVREGSAEDKATLETILMHDPKFRTIAPHGFGADMRQVNREDAQRVSDAFELGLRDIIGNKAKGMDYWLLGRRQGEDAKTIKADAKWLDAMNKTFTPSVSVHDTRITQEEYDKLAEEERARYRSSRFGGYVKKLGDKQFIIAEESPTLDGISFWDESLVPASVAKDGFQARMWGSKGTAAFGKLGKIYTPGSVIKGANGENITVGNNLGAVIDASFIKNYKGVFDQMTAKEQSDVIKFLYEEGLLESVATYGNDLDAKSSGAQSTMFLKPNISRGIKATSQYEQILKELATPEGVMKLVFNGRADTPMKDGVIDMSSDKVMAEIEKFKSDYRRKLLRGEYQYSAKDGERVDLVRMMSNPIFAELSKYETYADYKAGRKNSTMPDWLQRASAFYSDSGSSPFTRQTLEQMGLMKDGKMDEEALFDLMAGHSFQGKSVAFDFDNPDSLIASVLRAPGEAGQRIASINMASFVKPFFEAMGWEHNSGFMGDASVWKALSGADLDGDEVKAFVDNLTSLGALSDLGLDNNFANRTKVAISILDGTFKKTYGQELLSKTTDETRRKQYEDLIKTSTVLDFAETQRLDEARRLAGKETAIGRRGAAIQSKEDVVSAKGDDISSGTIGSEKFGDFPALYESIFRARKARYGMGMASNAGMRTAGIDFSNPRALGFFLMQEAFNKYYDEYTTLQKNPDEVDLSKAPEMQSMMRFGIQMSKARDIMSEAGGWKLDTAKGKYTKSIDDEMKELDAKDIIVVGNNAYSREALLGGRGTREGVHLGNTLPIAGQFAVLGNSATDVASRATASILTAKGLGDSALRDEYGKVLEQVMLEENDLFKTTEKGGHGFSKSSNLYRLYQAYNEVIAGELAGTRSGLGDEDVTILTELIAGSEADLRKKAESLALIDKNGRYVGHKLDIKDSMLASFFDPYDEEKKTGVRQNLESLVNAYVAKYTGAGSTIANVKGWVGLNSIAGHEGYVGTGSTFRERRMAEELALEKNGGTLTQEEYEAIQLARAMEVQAIGHDLAKYRSLDTRTGLGSTNLRRYQDIQYGRATGGIGSLGDYSYRGYLDVDPYLAGEMGYDELIKAASEAYTQSQFSEGDNRKFNAKIFASKLRQAEFGSIDDPEVIDALSRFMENPEGYTAESRTADYNRIREYADKLGGSGFIYEGELSTEAAATRGATLERSQALEEVKALREKVAEDQARVDELAKETQTEEIKEEATQLNQEIEANKQKAETIESTYANRSNADLFAKNLSALNTAAELIKRADGEMTMINNVIGKVEGNETGSTEYSKMFTNLDAEKSNLENWINSNASLAGTREYDQVKTRLAMLRERGHQGRMDWINSEFDNIFLSPEEAVAGSKWMDDFKKGRSSYTGRVWEANEMSSQILRDLLARVSKDNNLTEEFKDVYSITKNEDGTEKKATRQELLDAIAKLKETYGSQLNPETLKSIEEALEESEAAEKRNEDGSATASAQAQLNKYDTSNVLALIARAKKLTEQYKNKSKNGNLSDLLGEEQGFGKNAELLKKSMNDVLKAVANGEIQLDDSIISKLEAMTAENGDMSAIISGVSKETYSTSKIESLLKKNSSKLARGRFMSSTEQTSMIDGLNTAIDTVDEKILEATDDKIKEDLNALKTKLTNQLKQVKGTRVGVFDDAINRFRSDSLMTQEQDLTSRTFGLTTYGIQGRNYYRQQENIYEQEIRNWEREKQDLESKKQVLGESPENADQVKEIDSRIEQLNKRIDDHKNKIIGLTNDYNSWKSTAVGVISQISQKLVQLSSKMSRQFVQSTKQFIVQFDSMMASIQSITFKTDEEMDSVKSNIIGLAVDLKTSVKNVSSVQEALYRQGLSEEEVNRRTETVVKYSTVTGTDVNSAMKQLTAAVQSGLVSNVEKAADVLVALGDTVATTAEQIAKGMQKSAAAAKNAGVDYEELATMLAIGTSTTQLGGTQIGRALNTMMSRYRRVTTSGITDSAGGASSINDVEAALANAGIKIRDSANSFRSFTDIMEDLSKVWISLSDVQQANISYTMAGTTQSNVFQSLLAGMADGIDGKSFSELLEAARNSSETTEEKYDIKVDTISAAIEQLKASIDGVSERFSFLGDIAKDLIVSFSDVINFFNNNSFSGLLTGTLVTILPVLLKLSPIVAAIVAGGTLAVAGIASLVDAITDTETAAKNHNEALTDATAVTVKNQKTRTNEYTSAINTLLNKSVASSDDEKLINSVDAKTFSTISSLFEALKESGIEWGDGIDLATISLGDFIEAINGASDATNNYTKVQNAEAMKNIVVAESTLEKLEDEEDIVTGEKTELSFGSIAATKSVNGTLTQVEEAFYNDFFTGLDDQTRRTLQWLINTGTDISRMQVSDFEANGIDSSIAKELPQKIKDYTDNYIIPSYLSDSEEYIAQQKHRDIATQNIGTIVSTYADQLDNLGFDSDKIEQIKTTIIESLGEDLNTITNADLIKRVQEWLLTNIAGVVINKKGDITADELVEPYVPKKYRVTNGEYDYIGSNQYGMEWSTIIGSSSSDISKTIVVPINRDELHDEYFAGYEDILTRFENNEITLEQAQEEINALYDKVYGDLNNGTTSGYQFIHSQSEGYEDKRSVYDITTGQLVKESVQSYLPTDTSTEDFNKKQFAEFAKQYSNVEELFKAINESEDLIDQYGSYFQVESISSVITDIYNGTASFKDLCDAISEFAYGVDESVIYATDNIKTAQTEATNAVLNKSILDGTASEQDLVQYAINNGLATGMSADYYKAFEEYRSTNSTKSMIDAGAESANALVNSFAIKLASSTTAAIQSFQDSNYISNFINQFETFDEALAAAKQEFTDIDFSEIESDYRILKESGYTIGKISEILNPKAYLDENGNWRHADYAENLTRYDSVTGKFIVTQQKIDEETEALLYSDKDNVQYSVLESDEFTPQVFTNGDKQYIVDRFEAYEGDLAALANIVIKEAEKDEEGNYVAKEGAEEITISPVTEEVAVASLYNEGYTSALNWANPYSAASVMLDNAKQSGYYTADTQNAVVLGALQKLQAGASLDTILEGLSGSEISLLTSSTTWQEVLAKQATGEDISGLLSEKITEVQKAILEAAAKGITDSDALQYATAQTDLEKWTSISNVMSANKSYNDAGNLMRKLQAGTINETELSSLASYLGVDASLIRGNYGIASSLYNAKTTEVNKKNTQMEKAMSDRLQTALGLSDEDFNAAVSAAGSLDNLMSSVADGTYEASVAAKEVAYEFEEVKDSADDATTSAEKLAEALANARDTIANEQTKNAMADFLDTSSLDDFINKLSFNDAWNDIITGSTEACRIIELYKEGILSANEAAKQLKETMTSLNEKRSEAEVNAAADALLTSDKYNISSEQRQKIERQRYEDLVLKDSTLASQIAETYPELINALEAGSTAEYEAYMQAYKVSKWAKENGVSSTVSSGMSENVSGYLLATNETDRQNYINSMGEGYGQYLYYAQIIKNAKAIGGVGVKGGISVTADELSAAEDYFGAAWDSEDIDGLMTEVADSFAGLLEILRTALGGDVVEAIIASGKNYKYEIGNSTSISTAQSTTYSEQTQAAYDEAVKKYLETGDTSGLEALQNNSEVGSTISQILNSTTMSEAEKKYQLQQSTTQGKTLGVQYEQTEADANALYDYIAAGDYEGAYQYILEHPGARSALQTYYGSDIDNLLTLGADRTNAAATINAANKNYRKNKITQQQEAGTISDNAASIMQQIIEHEGDNEWDIDKFKADTFDAWLTTAQEANDAKNEAWKNKSRFANLTSDEAKRAFMESAGYNWDSNLTDQENYDRFNEEQDKAISDADLNVRDLAAMWNAMTPEERARFGLPTTEEEFNNKYGYNPSDYVSYVAAQTTTSPYTYTNEQYQQRIGSLASTAASSEEFLSGINGNIDLQQWVLSDSAGEIKTIYEQLTKGTIGWQEAQAKLNKELKKDSTTLNSYSKNTRKLVESYRNAQYYAEKTSYNKSKGSEDMEYFAGITGLNYETLKEMSDDELRDVAKSEVESYRQQLLDSLNEASMDVAPELAKLFSTGTNENGRHTFNIGGIDLVAGEVNTIGVEDAIAVAQQLGNDAIVSALEPLVGKEASVALEIVEWADGSIHAYYNGIDLGSLGGGKRSSSSSGGGSSKSNAQTKIDYWKNRISVSKHHVNMVQKDEEYYKNRGELTNYGNLIDDEIREQKELSTEYTKAIKDLKAQYAKTTDADDKLALRDQIFEYEEAVEDCRNAIDQLNDAWEENQEAIRQTKISVEDMLREEIEDREQIEEDMLNATVNMQNTVLEAIKDRYQEESDLRVKD